MKKLLTERGNNSFLRGIVIFFSFVSKIKINYILNLIGWCFVYYVMIYPSFIFKDFYDYLDKVAKSSENFSVAGIIDITKPLIIIILIKCVVIIFCGYLFFRLFYTINYNIRYKLVEKIITQYPSKNKFSMGEGINSIKEDTNHIFTAIDSSLDLFAKFFYNVVIFITLFRIDAYITLILYLPLILIAIVAKVLNNRIIVERKKSRSGASEVSALLGDLFNNIQTIKVEGKEKQIINRLKKYSELRRKSMIRDNLVQELLFNISSVVSGVGTAVVLISMAVKLREGTLGLGDFAIFNMLLYHASSFFEWVGRVSARFTQSTVSIDRLMKITSSNDIDFLLEFNNISIQDDDLENTLKSPRESLKTLEVRNLYSSYPEGNGIKDINFKINRGEFVVVTGRIGSGKTTLLKTLIGIKERDSGEIFYNGREICEENILIPPYGSYTSQVPELFSDSIKNNVTLEKGNDFELIKKSYNDAILLDDINRYDLKDETIIGNKGVKLSGGQKQRVAIARMLYNESEIFILDDVSSALDVNTEIELWEKIANRDKTILAVSNKHVCLEKADKILVLKDGNVDSFGTKEELLKTSKEFNEIWGNKI